MPDSDAPTPVALYGSAHMLSHLIRYDDLERVDWDAVGVPENARKAFWAAAGYWLTNHRPAPMRGRLNYGEILTWRHHALYMMYSSGFSPESPIEEILGAWLLWQKSTPFEWPHVAIGPEFEEGTLSTEYPRFFIQAQAEVEVDDEIGTIHPDFVLGLGLNGRWRKLGIECDGHDFHERTKEQAARDKRRDRSSFLSGVPILRFTGSEIYNEPAECMNQIEDAVDHLASELWRSA